MRLLMMHRNDSKTEAGEVPPAELIEQMGEFIGEYARAGQFLGGEGLRGSDTRTRLTFRAGAMTVKHGPYRGEHELPAAILQLTVKTREQAIGWAERYGKILGDGEIELGPVTEAWDLGMMPRPTDPPLRVLLVEKADAASEAGKRSPKQKADLTRLRTEMQKAGVLVQTIPLAPSSTGKRLRFQENRLTVLDGPFIESKELIGGFCIMELPSLDEAVEVTRRYAAILGGTLEVDLRPIATDE